MTLETNSAVSKNILLVDDDVDDRELFVEALSFVDPDSTVKTLDHSDGLIDYLRGLPTLPDFLFLDLNMPRKSGKECLKEIQSHRKLKEMKIVIYTTSINPKDVAETYQHGAFCFFQKPNSFSDLKRLLHRVINSSEASYSFNNGFVISGQSK